MDPDTTFLQRLACVGAEAASLRDYRQRALTLLRQHVVFDCAVFHALSPRVPMDTGAFLGLDIGRVAALVPEWDRFAVELGRLRDVALSRGGVTTDAEAFPRGSSGRARFDGEIAQRLDVRALLIAHLVVRGAIRAAVLLFLRHDLAFPEDAVELVRSAVPVLSVADALHESLDGAPRAAVPVRLRCLDQRLTARQREIVELVALGHTNDAIARALGLSPNTLRNHLAEVFRRLGASNRADVVRLTVLRPPNG